MIQRINPAVILNIVAQCVETPKIVNGCFPQYFKDYISYVNDKHIHNTRPSTDNK